MNTSSLAEKTFTFTKSANDGIEFLNIVTKSGYDEIITDRISLFESGNEADLLFGVWQPFKPHGGKIGNIGL